MTFHISRVWIYFVMIYFVIVYNWFYRLRTTTSSSNGEGKRGESALVPPHFPFLLSYRIIVVLEYPVIIIILIIDIR